MNIPAFNDQPSKRGKITDPNIMTGSRYEKEFGLFDSVFHEVSNAIIIISRKSDGESPLIKDVNHHFELVTGYQLAEVHDKNLYDFMSKPSLNQAKHTIEKALESRQAAVLSCPWVDKNGKILDLDLTLRPFNSDENGSHFICVFRENISKDNDRDRAAKEIKRNLLSAMHHNFRTPLNGILGYSEVIMSELFGPIGQDSYKSCAQDIHGAGKDLLQLIDNLLELKELETAEFELYEEKFILSDMISECLAKISNESEKKNIKLSSFIDSDIPYLYGDKSRIQQMVHSLLTNSLKFTSSGGCIIITVSRDREGACLISCKDDGEGMPSQQLAKVFCHDTHLSDIYSNPTVGIGFGLSYVKQLIQKHGGTVSIVSSVGKGTTVTLQLPSERLCLA